jgi:chorismate-pyruvate lyase
MENGPQIEALLRRFNAELLSSDSATRVLERWFASPIAALRLQGPAKPLPAEHAQRLRLLAGEQILHRRVNLVAKGQVLCVAENWYIPERLTAEMNRALEHTTTPFGYVIAPLKPRRQTLSVITFWPDAQGGLDDAVMLEHRTVLTAADGRALSVVHEAYTKQIFRVAG